MSLVPEDQEIAETLLRKWKGQKEVNCYRRQLTRVTEAFDVLSAGIKSELEGKQEHKVVRRQDGGTGFSSIPINRVGGRIETYDLPTSDELEELTNGYRAACEALKKSEREVSEL